LTAPTYLGAAGPIPPLATLVVVYDGPGAATLTLPAVAWYGAILDAGPGAVTLQGYGGAPVNGLAVGVTLVVGSGGIALGDPAGGWWYVGMVSGSAVPVLETG
jgi:hypothetical protein